MPFVHLEVFGTYFYCSSFINVCAFELIPCFLLLIIYITWIKFQTIRKVDALFFVVDKRKLDFFITYR